MRAFLCVCLATCLAASVAQPATGQDQASDEEHRTSIVLGVDGDESVGIWRLVSDRWEFGVDLSISGTRLARNGFRVVDLSATPGFKRHFSSARSEVSPYVYFGVPLTLLRASQTYDPGSGEQEVDDYGTGAGATLGLGLQVRPMERIAIGGHAGIGARYHWGRRERNGIKTDNRNSAWAGTLSSGIRVQLFF